MNYKTFNLALIFAVISMPWLIVTMSAGADYLDPLSQTATRIVTSSADSGPGTLRQALMDAQVGDMVTFDPFLFPPTNPVTISLSSQLPTITQDNLILDGSDAGVILDGSLVVGEIFVGLGIEANGVKVRGLQIINFAGNGIGIFGHNNMIGGDPGIGSGPFGQGNLIGKNDNSGIAMVDSGTFSNTIQGNLIGVDPTGKLDWGNAGDGIHINSAHHNLIINNIIGGNTNGIQGCCSTDTNHNVIRDNWIGIGADGSTPIPNTHSGVWFHDGASYNTVGPDNIIAYASSGIIMHTVLSLGNTITHNRIFSNSYGIVLNDGSNGGLLASRITGFDWAFGLIKGHTCPNCKVEVFSDLGNQGGTYEGSVQAAPSGYFTFDKGMAFTNPHLTTTTTDLSGNTSPFSLETNGTGAEWIIQTGNNTLVYIFETRQSAELLENRISGATAIPRTSGMDDQQFIQYQYDETFNQGIKQMHIYLNENEEPINWSRSDYQIDPIDDAWIDLLGQHGVSVVFGLSFWDKDNHPTGWPPISSRFTTEEEIQRYLDYVHFIVDHFKGRIQYYELWNEPDNNGTLFQFIEPVDYVELIRRVAPVIREADPSAKVVVGGVSYLQNPYCQQYINTIIQSDVLPLVDVISWHPMYGTSPDHAEHRDYYYAYPQIVRTFQQQAYANGFAGTFRGDEMFWCSPESSHIPPGFPMHTKYTAAKYLGRGIVINLGLGLVAGAGTTPYAPRSFKVVQNLTTVFSGMDVLAFPIEVSTTITNVASYTFSLPNAYLVALWNDGIAVDEDPGVTATIRLPGFAGFDATGIDPLHSTQQGLTTRSESDTLVIENLQLRDYPVLIRLSQIYRIFLPLVIR